LVVECLSHAVYVTLTTRKHQLLVWTKAEPAEVKFHVTKSGSYHLWAGAPSFKLSQQEFETLRAKLEPRGIKVDRS
jgi:hypothetical protein